MKKDKDGVFATFDKFIDVLRADLEAIESRINSANSNTQSLQPPMSKELIEQTMEYGTSATNTLFGSHVTRCGYHVMVTTRCYVSTATTSMARNNRKRKASSQSITTVPSLKEYMSGQLQAVLAEHVPLSLKGLDRTHERLVFAR